MNEILEALKDRREDLKNLPNTLENLIKREENLTSTSIVLELNAKRINEL
jgi:hypothetical protein